MSESIVGACYAIRTVACNAYYEDTEEGHALEPVEEGWFLRGDNVLIWFLKDRLVTGRETLLG